MKRKAVISLLLILVSASSFSQEKKQPVAPLDSVVRELYPQRVRNIFKTTPLAMISGTVPFLSEFRLINEFVTSKKQASQMSFSYLGKGPVLFYIEELLKSQGDNINLVGSGFGFQAWHKFYLGKYSPKGLYLAPQVSYAIGRVSEKRLNQYDLYLQWTHASINMLMGAQILIADKAAIDFYWGLGYKQNSLIYHESATNFTYLDDELPGIYTFPVKFNAGVHFGWAF